MTLHFRWPPKAPRLAHDGILNSRIKTKLSHHLRQLNLVNLESQPHSELSSNASNQLLLDLIQFEESLRGAQGTIVLRRDPQSCV